MMTTHLCTGLFAASVAMIAGSANAQSAAAGQTLWTAGRTSPATPACGSCHNGAADAANGLTLAFIRSRLAGTGGLTQDNAAALINRALRRPGGVGAMLAAYPPGSISTTDLADLAAFIAQAPPPPSAVASATPTSLSFGATAVNADSATQLVTISNAAGQPITLANVPISALTTSEHPGDFLIGSSGTLDGNSECSAGLVLQPAARCAIRVLFRPAQSGSRSAQWEVRFTAGNPVLLQLSGTATAAAAPAPPPTPAPSPVPPGSSSEAAGTSGGGGAVGVGLLTLLLGALAGRRGCRVPSRSGAQAGRP